MKIEIWSDFVCPFCYIGKRRLEHALNQTPSDESIEIIFKSFELDPNAAKSYDVSINELIAKKYGISIERATASNQQIISQAKALGLNYNFDDMKPTNTFDAHRLVHLAKSFGKDKELAERFFKAYFEDSLLLSDANVLAHLAEEIGLDRELVLETLSSSNYETDVRNDENRAHSLNITGVPYFIFDGKYAVSGAQPSEVFLEVINKVKSEANLAHNPKDASSSDALCADGQCKI
ncbi:DsbA family oxidoreductase [Fusibacter bizertensis]